MVEDRINWIDMAKGYGILGVIIGHISTPGITVWIYTFHIPLFFFMSGFLFNTNYSLVVFLNRKIKALLIPYFCLAILIVFHELLFNRGFCWRSCRCSYCGTVASGKEGGCSSGTERSYNLTGGAYGR